MNRTIKETLRMSTLRHAILAALLGALALLVIQPAASAAAEPEPWWQVETGARPTNLWKPADESEAQEVTTAKAPSGVVAVAVEVEGEVIGCLGAGELGLLGLSANALCESKTGFPAVEDAAGFKAMLEGSYGAGVQVSGGPVGEAALRVTTPGRWPPSLAVRVLTISLAGSNLELGSASATVTSEGSGRLVLTITNIGDAPADGASQPITVVDQLPAGVVAYGVAGFAGFRDKDGPVTCSVLSPDEISCSLTREVPLFEAIEIEIETSVEPPVEGTGTVTVQGGGAPAATAVQALHVSPEKTGFGVESFHMRAEEEGGAAAGQAGGHPFQLTTVLQLNSGPVLPGSLVRADTIIEQPALPRNFRFPLPVGLVGDPSSIPTCTFQQFTTRQEGVFNGCPAESAIGVASVTIIEPGTVKFGRLAVPIFNLVPAFGEPARFGFMAAGVPVTIDAALDSEDEYRVSALATNVPQTAELLATTAVFWGNPGDPRHDSARGWDCVYWSPRGPCTTSPTLSRDAFLRNPVNCTSPLDFGMELEPWNAPLGSDIEKQGSPSPALLGCSKVPFDPSIAAAPTSKLTTNPSGLDFELGLPNANLRNPEGIAETEPKKTEVDLPEGVTVNPSEAEGLAVCTEAQFNAEKVDSQPGEGCPEASKLGSVVSHTPLVEGAIEGSLYIAKPYENPFNSLLALYLVARLPERGVLVKQAGIVEPDPVTGQLRTSFDNLPQLPYSDFKLHFREGGRAPLVTPPACGTYDTVAKFVPYSAADPANPAPSEIVERTSPFTTERGTDGGPCPSGGTPPFHPGLEAGTINNAAGHYSPFYIRLSRSDSEQEFTHFSIKLPPGVTGKLAGIPFCGDAEIAAAKARERTPHGGQEEIQRPSCPAASQIGRILAGAGVGSVLTYVPGRVYMAGPYHGSNLSIVAITAAKAGPFDLGTVVIREALKVDPVTAEVSVDAAGSDPLPHIIAGIPVHLRDIRVYVDKPDFMLNPTSCAPTSTASTVLGSGTNFATEADDRPVTVATRFQAADCASLGFAPRLKLMLKGPTKRTGLPRLKAVVTPRPGQANIGRAVVTLPRSEFLEQGHIGTTCTRVQFNAGGGNGEQCPAKSVYGRARAWTPLLAEPLSGPVFLRSNGGERRLPDLVAALHSKDIDINLLGFIKSLHPKGASYSRIRSIFASVPDAPVSRFVLEMFGGKKSLLINSVNLCKGKHRAISTFVGQNGKRDETRPPVQVKCKHKGRHHKKAHGHFRHTRRGDAHLAGRRHGAR